jgi:hypothetical protein
LKEAVAPATAALARFGALNAQLIELSRRNSEVRSLALSLGEKRTLAAECEARLSALKEHLEKHTFPATR